MMIALININPEPWGTLEHLGALAILGFIVVCANNAISTLKKELGEKQIERELNKFKKEIP